MAEAVFALPLKWYIKENAALVTGNWSAGSNGTNSLFALGSDLLSAHSALY